MKCSAARKEAPYARSTLGVFLFHASNVFNTAGFEIKNAEQSEVITIVQGVFFPWGKPLFFLVAGAGSWFALRRRSASQFARERTLRLLVPFLTGTLLLGPIQLYLSWRHWVETGLIDWTFGVEYWQPADRCFLARHRCIRRVCMDTTAPASLDPPSARLYALDWLRVLAVLGVFLFHAVHPFDLTAWHIKNAEQSAVVTFFIAFVFPWGMPFFFLLAGAGSLFALRRRTPGAYARERFNRLLLPFVAGSLLLMPVMLYFEWRHKLQTGALAGSYLHFLLDRNVGFTPIWFGALGYHLWFLGFLFSFSILCLPLFLWLRGDTGRQLTANLARLCQRRGVIVLCFVPLALVRLALHPFFPEEHSWADFFVQLSFFVLGYLLFSQQAFLAAIRRDWRIILGVGVAAAAGALAIAAATGTLDLQAPPRTAVDLLFWTLIALDSWCWTLFFLYLGLRYLEYSNSYLKYGQGAILPFFVFHQPVIIVLAYYAVQWPLSLGVKLLFVVVGSFCVTLGIYEFLVRRIAALRLVFGVKQTPVARAAR